MGRIDYDELQKLERLLEDEVINQDEYNAKIASICNISVNNDTIYEGKNALPIIMGFIIAILICVSVNFGIESNNLRVENSRLQDRIHNLSLKNMDTSLALKLYYMDTAVLVVKGDNAYYHRYNCPDLGSNYDFWMYNVEAARGMGYKECPTCFSYSQDSYIDKFF